MSQFKYADYVSKCGNQVVNGHPLKQVSMPNLFCLVCNKSCPEVELSGHVASVHFGFLPLACTSCDFTAAQEAEVLQHADKEGHIPFVIDRSVTKPYVMLLSKFIAGHSKVLNTSKNFSGILTGLTSHIAADLSQLDVAKRDAQIASACDSETSSERSSSTPQSTLARNLEPGTDAGRCGDGSGTTILGFTENLPRSVETPQSRSNDYATGHANSTNEVSPAHDQAAVFCALCASNEAFSADQREGHIRLHLNPSGVASKANSNPAAYFSALANMWQLCFPPIDLVSGINSGGGTRADLILHHTDEPRLAAPNLSEAALPLLVLREQPQATRSPLPDFNPTPSPRLIASDRLTERQSPQSLGAPTYANPTPSPQSIVRANYHAASSADQLLPSELIANSSPHSNAGQQMLNLFDIVAVKKEIVAQRRSAAVAGVPEIACGEFDGVRCGLCQEDPSRYQQLDKEAHVVQHVERSGLSLATNSSVFFDVVSRFWQICFPSDRQTCEVNRDQSSADNATDHSDQTRQLFHQENPSLVSEEHANAAGNFERLSGGNEPPAFLGNAILSDVIGSASPLVPEVGMFEQEVEDEDQAALSMPVMSRDHKNMRRSDVCAVCGEILAPPKKNRSPKEQKAVYRAKRNHVWKNHAPALPYRCGSCENAAFSGKFDLKRHRKSQHPDVPNGELDGRSAEEKAKDFALFDRCFPFEKHEDTLVSVSRPSSAVNFSPVVFPSSTDVRRSGRKHSVFAAVPPSPKCIKLDPRSLQQASKPPSLAGSSSSKHHVSQRLETAISLLRSVSDRSSEISTRFSLEQRSIPSQMKAARRKVKIAKGRSSKKTPFFCRLCQKPSWKMYDHVWANHMADNKRWTCAVCQESHNELCRLKQKCAAKHAGVETLTQAHSDSVLQLYETMLDQCFDAKPTDNSPQAARSFAMDLATSPSRNHSPTLSSMDLRRGTNRHSSSGLLSSASTSSKCVVSASGMAGRIWDPSNSNVRRNGRPKKPASQQQTILRTACGLCHHSIRNAHYAGHVWTTHMQGHKMLACGICGAKGNRLATLRAVCFARHPDSKPVIIKAVTSPEVKGEYEHQYTQCFGKPPSSNCGFVQSAMLKRHTPPDNATRFRPPNRTMASRAIGADLYPSTSGRASIEVSNHHEAQITDRHPATPVKSEQFDDCD